jgi:hypothetical protein
VELDLGGVHRDVSCRLEQSDTNRFLAAEPGGSEVRPNRELVMFRRHGAREALCETGYGEKEHSE